MRPRLLVGSILVLGIGALTAAMPVHLADVPLFGDASSSPRDASGQSQEILMLERELPLGRGGPLRIEVHDADVSLRAREGETARVRIYAWSRDGDEAWARTVFERAAFRVEGLGGGVSVTSREVEYDREDRRRHRGFGLRVEVEHPAAVAADVSTEDGDLAATRLQGPVRLRTADGDISVGSAEGPEIELRTSDGDVEVGEARGGSLVFVTSDGDVTVARLDADRLETETSDGDIVLRDARATRLSMTSSDGDLVLSGLETEDGRLETAEGDVSVEDLRGPLRAVTSEGDVQVSMLAPAPLRLTTTEGDVTIRLPDGAGFELDLAGGSVSVGGGLRAESGEGRPGRYRASVLGGGPRIEARTSDGSVTVGTGGGL